jgi:hypothetical protein
LSDWLDREPTFELAHFSDGEKAVSVKQSHERADGKLFSDLPQVYLLSRVRKPRKER